MSINEVNTIKNTSGVTEITFGSYGSWSLGGTNGGTSGQVLTSQGSGSVPTWADYSSGGAGMIGTQVFTSSGTFTPTSGATNFLVFCIGGGGGSGTANTGYGGAGGGSGGCSWRYYNTSEMGSSASVTIGSGGGGGYWTGLFGIYTGWPGYTGGSSTFNPGGTGVTLTGGGGEGGGFVNAYYAGIGGNSTNSLITWTGIHGEGAYGTYLGLGGASVAFGYGKGGDGSNAALRLPGNAGESGGVVIFEY